MGYNTKYTLTLDQPERVKEINEHIEALKLFEFELYPDRDNWYGESKWYDHEEDMRKISRIFPDVVFALQGVGEEYPDIWVKYFQNGKMQSEDAQIYLPSFDKDKLG
jgi:hypothetical protein